MSQPNRMEVVRVRGGHVKAEPCLFCGEPMTSYQSRVKGFHKDCQPRFPSTGRLIPNTSARLLYLEGRDGAIHHIFQGR